MSTRWLHSALVTAWLTLPWFSAAAVQWGSSAPADGARGQSDKSDLAESDVGLPVGTKRYQGGATDLRQQHKHTPPPHTGPIHIRQEIGNIFLAGTISDQRSGLRSAINGFWREPLNIRGNFSPCCESSPLSRFSKPIPILRMSTPHAWSFSATIAMK